MTPCQVDHEYTLINHTADKARDKMHRTNSGGIIIIFTHFIRFLFFRLLHLLLIIIIVIIIISNIFQVFESRRMFFFHFITTGGLKVKCSCFLPTDLSTKRKRKSKREQI